MSAKGRVVATDLRLGYSGDIVLAMDDFRVEPGEFVSILGPSGCGKTTLLSSLAGFVPPAKGRVEVDGKDITYAPPQRRPTGMVFQSYALFPHMTVEQNLHYGLKARKVPKQERTTRVKEALSLVRLGEFARRYPKQLSGGQQQRVAIARAIVTRPAVLLLDEPLSNLDAKLRRQMRDELRELQQEIGTTMIFVTHDQDEALAMSDRIVLLSNGKVEQEGTPEELYAHPRTAFVADFIGGANLLTGRVRSECKVRLLGRTAHTPVELTPGALATFALRPETISVVPAKNSDATGAAQIVSTLFAGDHYEYRVRTEQGDEVRASSPENRTGLSPGSRVNLEWRDADLTAVEDDDA